MKIFRNIDEFKPNSKTVLTTGTFDGVHLGHKVIINRLKEIAKLNGGETTILTFFPHPRMVLYPEQNDLRLLNTISERIGLLEDSGIDNLIIHPFSKEFSKLKSIEFVRDILVEKCNIHKLVIGYDHHFGRNREGTFEHLQEYGPLYGFDVEEIPAQDIQQVNISSTKVRNSLLQGEVFAANEFLGYNYFIEGKVIGGEKLGRTIGFPTANLELNEWYKLVPANGVYSVKIKLENDIYLGMMNIGNRPTVNGVKETVEVHIFDFDQDIYGKNLEVEFISRIRNEQKFDDISALKNQLIADKQTALEILN